MTAAPIPAGQTIRSRRRRVLTDARIERMVRLRERGWAPASIARQLDVSEGAVSYQCLRLGVVSPKRMGRRASGGPSTIVCHDGRTIRRFSDEEDAQLRAHVAAGLKVGAIAIAMDRPRTSIRMRLLTLGSHEDIAS